MKVDAPLEFVKSKTNKRLSELTDYEWLTLMNQYADHALEVASNSAEVAFKDGNKTDYAGYSSCDINGVTYDIYVDKSSILKLKRLP